MSTFVVVRLTYINIKGGERLSLFPPNFKVVTNHVMMTFATAGEAGVEENRYYTDSVHLSSSGIRRLTRNWEQVVKKMVRTADGHVFCR